MKFAANLGFLFTREASNLIDRISLAASSGFQGVEFGYPYDVDAEKLAGAIKAAGIEQVLLNSWPGNSEAGELGIAIDPARTSEFHETLELSVKYLKLLSCKRLHILAGKTLPSSRISAADLKRTFIENVRYAAERLEREGVMALIEAINPRSVPGYWLNDPDQAEHIVRQVAHPNLRLQFDIFHAQIIKGDLTRRIQDSLSLIGHVQIAQVPNRDEPDSPGEIDYRYILQLLEQSGYNGWVGLEYRPRGATVAGLGWLKDWGYTG
jgi:hydroxypyruvate isomerase